MMEAASAGDNRVCDQLDGRERRRVLGLSTLLGGVVVFAAFCSIGVVYQRSVDAVHAIFSAHLLRLAQAAASQVDVARHQQIQSPEQQDAPEFRDVVRPLRKMLQGTEGVKYIYTAVCRNNQVFFVVDSAIPGDHDGDGRDDQAKILEHYETAEPALLRCFREQKPVASPAPYRDEWCRFMTGYAPFFDSAGQMVGVVGVDVKASQYDARLHAVYLAAWIATIPALVIAFVFGAIVYWAARTRLVARHYRERVEAELRQRADELLAARDEALAARREAESANRSKSEFLANVSHEIRTPMTAILGYTEVLLDDLAIQSSDADTKRRYDSLKTIHRNGEHLLDVINDILDLSKIEAGRMDVKLVRTDPRQILSEVLEVMQLRLQHRPIQLMETWDPAIPNTILSDPLRLKQILVNLVGNAVKFTERGNIAIDIGRDDTHRETPRLAWIISDTGIGMNAAEISQLFRPFSQADSSVTRRYGGSGLGLYISQRMAGLLGGEITVASEPGKGSVVRLTIEMGPLEETREVPPTITSHEAAMHVETALGGSLQGARVLLVEDGVDNQRLISFVLRRAGAHVEVADNGRVAIERLTQDGYLNSPLTSPPEFDLILMDMQMPEMDGYAATSSLRDKGCDLPIVALTAHAMNGESERCRAAGCSDFATKPIDRANLIARLAKWLELKSELAETS